MEQHYIGEKEKKPDAESIDGRNVALTRMVVISCISAGLVSMREQLDRLSSAPVADCDTTLQAKGDTEQSGLFCSGALMSE